jgi:hypothetical protein
VGGGAWISAALTVAVIAIHGYHPYAEDGGVYLVGIKHLLHPQLYPFWTGFVAAHLKLSLFAPAMAALVRVTHLDLMTAMLLIHAASILVTIFSAWLLASRCYTSRHARLGAVSMLALVLTVPVAGTSLMLMDPYVTARSISTPCGILMLVGTLDLFAAWKERRAIAGRSVALLACSFAVAGAMHPLMAGYSLACALLFAGVSLSSRRARITACLGMCILALAVAACIGWISGSDSPGYVEVARTRSYWFLSNWQWFEVLGLIGPLAVLILLARRNAQPGEHTSKRLAAMATLAGVTAGVVALLFAQLSSRSYAVAKLQPLRIFQTIYILMLLALGAAAADYVLKKSLLRWVALFVGLGGAMFAAQRQTFPDSAHIELPWRATENAWEQAFDWIRTHTPENAVFALDANYISASGEDSQNFRSVAERSAMPDYSKDGGIASIAPALTAQWLAGEAAQQNLDRSLGPSEIARLRSYGVNWVVVTRQTRAAVACSYSNAVVKVCPLP